MNQLYIRLSFVKLFISKFIFLIFNSMDTVVIISILVGEAFLILNFFDFAKTPHISTKHNF